MKSDKLQDALGMVDVDLIGKANEMPRKGKKRHIKWVVPIAAVLAIVIAVSPFFEYFSITNNFTSNQQSIEQTTKQNKPHIENPFILKSYAINQAEYPKMTQYPMTELGYEAWEKDQGIRRGYFGAGENLDAFFKATYSEFLSDAGKENKLYSPLNIYMALSMLAEITEGESRQQILDLLGADSIEALRKQANSVWNANYNDDGAVTSILASSLWLNKNIMFNDQTLKTLTDNYYASSYQGEMGSEKFNKALQEWLNQQTDGLLNEQISNINLDPQTVMAIATTIYYQAKWESEFQNSQNTKEIFHSPMGDINCEFMHKSETYGTYYWGESFSAVSKNLEMSGKMWFILPDENVNVDDLLKDNETLKFMTANGEWNNNKQLKVNLSIPKFDVCSDMDLKKGLNNLGVTDCFDFTVSNFSPLTVNFNDPIFISRVQHGVRVAIDEEGVTAAAYTLIPADGAARPPEDEIDFVLDRPFIFVITGEDGLPLFAGLINQP